MNVIDMNKKLLSILIISLFILTSTSVILTSGKKINIEKVNSNENICNTSDITEYGCSVDIDGNYAIVGAVNQYGEGTGVAYVFEKQGSSWVKQKLSVNDISQDDDFGSTVAIYGNTALVGAQYDENGKGSVYVFEREGGTWVKKEKITEDGARLFGWSVEIDGDNAIIGAKATPYDETDLKGGKAYIYNLETLSKEAVLEIPRNQYWFGSSVSIDEDYALVCSNYFAFLYKHEGASWVEKQQLKHTFNYIETSSIDVKTVENEKVIRVLIGKPGTVCVFDVLESYLKPGNDSIISETFKLTGSGAFGYSVDIDDNYAVIGARDDGCGKDKPHGKDCKQGAIFVYDTNTWQESARLESSDGACGDRFGNSVAIDADSESILVGLGNIYSKKVYVFKKADDNGWEESSRLYQPKSINKLPTIVYDRNFNFLKELLKYFLPFTFE